MFPRSNFPSSDPCDFPFTLFIGYQFSLSLVVFGALFNFSPDLQTAVVLNKSALPFIYKYQNEYFSLWQLTAMIQIRSDSSLKCWVCYPGHKVCAFESHISIPLTDQVSILVNLALEAFIWTEANWHWQEQILILKIWKCARSWERVLDKQRLVRALSFSASNNLARVLEK